MKIIFKFSKLSFYIKKDILISKLKKLLIKVKLQNSLKYWCFQGKDALFLIDRTQYHRLLEKQRNYHIVLLMIKILSKIPNRIIDEKYLLKNIISYH